MRFDQLENSAHDLTLEKQVRSKFKWNVFRRAYVDVDSDDAGQALSLNDSMWHGTKLLVKLDAKHLPSTKGYTGISIYLLISANSRQFSLRI